MKKIIHITTGNGAPTLISLRLKAQRYGIMLLTFFEFQNRVDRGVTVFGTSSAWTLEASDSLFTIECLVHRAESEDKSFFAEAYRSLKFNTKYHEGLTSQQYFGLELEKGIRSDAHYMIVNDLWRHKAHAFIHQIKNKW